VQHSHANLQIVRRNVGDQLVPKSVSSGKNVLDHPLCLWSEMNSFATAIVSGCFAFDPAIFLQTVQHPGKSGFFNPHPRGEISLRERLAFAREINKRGPFSLAETERLESLIKLVAPTARGTGQKLTDLLG